MPETAAPEELPRLCRERPIAPDADGFESGADDRADPRVARAHACAVDEDTKVRCPWRPEGFEMGAPVIVTW
jgi:hypothetical protein